MVECRTRHAYHQFARRLNALGFRVDQSPGTPVCRYRTIDGLVLDAGRAELASELQSLSLDARTFIAESVPKLLVAPWFDDVLEGTFPDAQRLPKVLVGIRERFSGLVPQTS